MPEEINRIVTDSLSDFLFTTSRDANENLINEGIPREKIFFVGNVMIDTLLRYLEIARNSTVLGKLGLGTRGVYNNWEIKKNYAVLTLHRPSNVDNYTTFSRIVEALTEVGRQMPIIFPIHPRTYNQIKAYGLERYFKFISGCNNYSIESGINCIDSLGYLDFLQLVTHSKLVLTDSGGLQEETTVLGIPCLTIRENTERPVTILEGTNVLVGTDKNKIVFEATNAINGYKKSRKIPELWDGNAAQRIIKILKEKQKEFCKNYLHQ
jgi:UDP-N-acetylglucosamine 2-epimerase (non-hydrolysing)